jgi:threonine dehydratase
VVEALGAPSIEEAELARARITDLSRITPVIPLLDDAGNELCSLKLECLQDTGSFKVRGAGNAIRSISDDRPTAGVYTMSAGNMAAAVARAGQKLGVPTAALVPENAPETKLAAIERWGAEVARVPYDQWWQAVIQHEWEPWRGREFVHPFADKRVMAGNATIALEIVDQVPEVQEVICAYGGGGLVCGIASALKQLKPETSIVVAEVEDAAPLRAAFEVGRPVEIPYTPSFVDGCGSKAVVDDMWPLVQGLVDDTITVSVQAVAKAVRLLAERSRVVAEGAGAVPLAAALALRRQDSRTVCVVSGGNVDSDKLGKILTGSVP